MDNTSIKIFSFQLEKLLNKFGNIHNFSEAFNIPQSTLKAWLSMRRYPKLDSLDKLANEIGCYSYQLISVCDLNDIGVHNNNARKAFVKNLNKIFIDKYCYTQLQKYTLLSNVLSNDALISYLRKDDYRKPTLEVLDKIANELNIKTYTLIKEDE